MDSETAERIRARALEVESEWWVLELRRRAGAGDELALSVLEHIAALELSRNRRADACEFWPECVGDGD
jgi:hypothetical protein